MASSQSSQPPPVHNYTDDARWQVISSVIPCIILASAALAMRLASRRIKHSRLLASDYLAISSLIFAWIGSLLLITAVSFGFGLHIELVSLSHARLIFINIFAAEICYGIGFTVIKLSIIMLYRQLFPTRFMLISTMILTVVVIMWGIAVVLVSIFTCNPIQGFWNFDVPTKCVNMKWFYIGISIPNIRADAFLLCLPLRDIWRLQLTRSTKAVISGLFALGVFVIVASCLRIHYTLAIDNSDPTWSFAAASIWSAVEMQIAVVCCCLPTVRPVLAYLAPKSIWQRFTSTYTPITNTYHNKKLQTSHNQGGLDNQTEALARETSFNTLYTNTNQADDTIITNDRCRTDD
ncbi:hypothetical protein F4781DRAFT_389675 [Annulohypoxylon bovei var. microspora]|nr:hypothetical protein F4781DRAFT_389675 [Annulohypoxylon bovei var. microspora]